MHHPGISSAHCFPQRLQHLIKSLYSFHLSGVREDGRKDRISEEVGKSLRQSERREERLKNSECI